MAERYFSVADVEALIPELTRVMKQVMAGARRGRAQARERLQAEQQPDRSGRRGILDRSAWRADKDARSSG